MSMRKNLNVIYRESKWISDDELLGIAFDENGAYSAYDLLVGEGSKTWIGGTSASGTGYRNIYDAKNVFKIEQSSEVSFPIEIRISNNNVYVYLLGVQI